MRYGKALGPTIWPLALCAGSMPVSAEDPYSDPDYEILDNLESAAKRRITGEILEAVVVSNLSGMSRTLGIAGSKAIQGSVVGFFMSELLTPTPIADGTYYLEYDDIKKLRARARHECGQVSRTFSKTKFQQAVDGVTGIAAQGSELFAARVEQHRQFWIVNRYQYNVIKCINWFESGRTSPFYPS